MLPIAMSYAILLVIYYATLLVTAMVAWPHTYGQRGSGRPFWLALGAIAASLPLIFSIRPAAYYGLAFNTTVFLWAADTHMDPHWATRGRRMRALVGGATVCLLPLLWSEVLRNWLAALLVPTVGHLVISGVATPLVRRSTSRVA
jgi:hypothetical protein